MAIIGKAEPRSEGIIERVAELVGCEPAVIDAIIHVETQADAFDPSKRLIIRPEFHKLPSCPYLDASQKKKAAKVSQPRLVGYANDPVRAGSVAWQYVDKLAAEVGEEPAYWITSFGSPQIMGFNFQMCKYDSPSAMVRAFADSEDEQLMAMGRFIVAAGIKDACRSRKWASIARLYNGVDYAKNAYDSKLSHFYETSEHAKGTTYIYPDDDVLELGAHSQEVALLQTRLNALGYHLNADGDFGVETRDAVRAAQFRLGLPVDGRVGPETRRLLTAAPAKDPPKTPVLQVVAASSTAKASLAQIGMGAVGAAVAAANAITPAPPAAIVVAPPTITDVENVVKLSDQGVNLAQKILSIGVDKILIALGIGAIIFGAIALYRRIDAHYQRKIG